MQFKYPELLWALFLLLIPIFIHLFQLRRFKKTPFTNVKLLQKVVSESRKSNNLKKWLLLFTRLLTFSTLIMAFTQPYLAKKIALRENENVIYFDDSFSMQAKMGQNTLFNNAIQELIKSVPRDKAFNLFTNTSEFRDITLEGIQNDLLALEPTAQQLNLEEIYLKAGSFFPKDNAQVKNLIIISDFQQRMYTPLVDTVSTVQKHFVRLSPEYLDNIALDTVYINSKGGENLELTALLSANHGVETTPVSLYDGDKLIAKTSAAFKKGKGQVTFTLSAEETILGKLEISDTGLPYDNHLYFNIDERDKPKVLAVGDENSDYLKKIYTDDEFVFTSSALKTLNYRDIDSQNLIILNELKNIPNSLIESLSSFVSNGGNLVLIPSTGPDISTYNRLLSRFSRNSFLEQINSEISITQISFSHPLYQNVFEKSISNFQYPKVSQYLKVRGVAPSVLSYQNGEPFLLGTNGIYIFTASISHENSNFKQSPLIVPTLYKMGANSLRLADLYHTMNGPIQVDVSQKLTKDHILKVSKGEYEFIPQQQTYANKVSLTFHDNLSNNGIYRISENGTSLKNISFNYPRDESELDYMELGSLQSNSEQDSIASLFQNLQNDNSITQLWKWFVIFAILFILIEVLILKYFK